MAFLFLCKNSALQIYCKFCRVVHVHGHSVWVFSAEVMAFDLIDGHGQVEALGCEQGVFAPFPDGAVKICLFFMLMARPVGPDQSRHAGSQTPVNTR
jgi:hypothetical protein